MTNHEVSIEAARAAPPLSVVGLSLMGVSLQDWVLVITLIYTALSLIFLIRDKVYRPWKDKNNGCK